MNKFIYKISYALFVFIFVVSSAGVVNVAIAASSCGTDSLGYIITDCDGSGGSSGSSGSGGTANSSEKPTVHIIGSDKIELTVGDYYNDAGAVAYDPQDGNITYKIKTSYNYPSSLMRTPGTYNVTYRVVDSDGNEAGAVRRIIVSPKSTTGTGGSVLGDSTTGGVNSQICEFNKADASINGIVDGDLIRAKGDIDVYIVKYVCNKKFKRLILSPHVFESYGHFDWDDVKDVTPSTVNSFTTSNFVRATSAGDVKVYRLYPSGDTGEKRWVTSEQVFLDNNWDWDSIYTINTQDRDAYTTGTPIN